MASSVPSESAAESAVNSFGIGTYDEDTNSSHGEDKNKKKTGISLPDGGGKDNIVVNEYYNYSSRNAAESLPGDIDRMGPRGRGPLNNYDSVVHSEAGGSIPSADDSVTPHADYFDPSSKYGSGDYWAKEDTGAYASKESIPGPKKNEDEFSKLKGLGNDWSGYTVQDQNVDNTGFPDPSRVDGTAVKVSSMRIATNHQIVRDLASGFIKEHGKKGATRRHVMAFLQESGSYTFLASDIIRCLNMEHGAEIRDTLDNFPVRTSSVQSLIPVRLAAIQKSFLDASLNPANPADVMESARRVAADLASALTAYERCLNHGV